MSLTTSGVVFNNQCYKCRKLTTINEFLYDVNYNTYIEGEGFGSFYTYGRIECTTQERGWQEEKIRLSLLKKCRGLKSSKTNDPRGVSG